MLKADMMDTRLWLLSYGEITGVAGGDIVVNGYPPSGGDNWWDRMPMFTYDYSNGFFSGGGGGGGGGSAGPGPELVDTDGEDVPDSEVIVVVADRAQVTAAQLAYLRAGFEIDIIRYLGIGTAILVPELGLAARLALGFGEAALSDTRDSVVDRLGDTYYQLDAADGRYDGSNAFDAGRGHPQARFR